MKYKVGDKVRIKSIDWYNKNKDNCGCVYAGNGFGFWKDMTKHCGKIMKIVSVKIDPEDSNKGYYFMENNKDKWTDEMIEGLVEEISFGTIYKLDRPDGYQFKDQDGNIINATKIILEKKIKYPKTYEECCKELNIEIHDLIVLDNILDTKEIVYRKNLDRLLNSFRKLLICRDAYWKIYGEENGLGKPWKPNWNAYDDVKYSIIVDNDIIAKRNFYEIQNTLSFPTKKMRDAFYENFKELIDECKELL